MVVTRFCLRNPVAVTLFYVLIGAAGLLAVFRMGRSILPPLQFPIVTVTAPYPGASAPEIERLVVEPLEEQLVQLPERDRLSASAQDGVAVLVVRFRFGANLSSARATVQQAVDAALPNMPRDLVPPLVSRDDLAQPPVLDEALSSAVLAPEALSALVERSVVPALRATAGVGTVVTSGLTRRQLTVAPLAGPLDALGATALDVYRTIQNSNDLLPGGKFTTPTQQTSVGIRAAALSAAELRAVPLAVPAGPTQVRIGDVARVTDGVADSDVVVRVDERPSIVLSVANAQNADAARTIDAARRTFARLAKTMPLVRFQQLRTDRPYTEAAVGGVLQTFGEGIALTVLVMLLFLRAWRDALIAAIAIPSSLAAAFAVMWAAGLTMNVLSLMGLSLTIGILVDDSIVIVEAIARSADRGLHGDEAALSGRRELGAAAFAITLVDVAVFAPIAFMTGIAGEFMRQFGLVVVIATAFSLVVSFTLTPLLSARWALQHRAGGFAGLGFEGVLAHVRSHARALPWTLRSDLVLRTAAAWHAFLNAFHALEGRVCRAYAGHWLRAAWAHRRLVVVATLVACAGSLVPLFGGAIPTEFSPPVDRGRVTVDVSFPAGTTLSHTDAAMTAIAERLLDDPDVRHVTTSAGRAFGGGSGDVFAANRAQISVVLSDASSSGSDVLERIKAMAPLVPDAAFAGSGTGMGGRPPIAYNLTGDAGDAGEVAVAARRLRTVLEANPFAADVRSSDGGAGPRLDVTIDPAASLIARVAPDDAAQTARIATGGAIATKARVASGLVDVVVRGTAAQRGDRDAVRRASVRNADGRLVPLAAVARFIERAQPLAIEREDGVRITTVSANARDGAPIGLVTADVGAQLRAPGFLPAGVSLAPRGDLEQFLDTAARILATLASSIVAVYAILAVLYRSYSLPLVIMATVPLASIGAFGSLFAINALRTIAPDAAILRGQTLNLYSMLGIVMLVGLVAKNGILLVEYAERGVRAGIAPLAAMTSAAERRFRPIVMTTFAMIAGMLPLALGETAGAEYRKALGTVVIGGLTSSLFLTLFVVPIAYVATRSSHARGARP